MHPFDFSAAAPFRRTIFLGTALLLSALLTGCSGEPSSSDVSRAVKANMEQAQQQALALGSNLRGLVPEVHDASKLGCAKENDAAYICDVELDMTPPRGVRTKSTIKARFVKGSDGWMVTR